MPRVGSAANECTETSTPERTRKVPSRLSENARIASSSVQLLNRPRLSVTASEWMSAVPTSHGMKRGVLHRIPEPVAAPAELVVRPPAAERDAAGEEGPGRRGPGPRPARPVLVEPSFEHRRARERERHREADVARVEHRRMDRERRVLQERVEIAPVGRRRIEAQERIRGGEREQQEAEADDAQHAEHARREARAAAARRRSPPPPSSSASSEDPQQQRAFVRAPQRRHAIEQRQRGVGILRDVARPRSRCRRTSAIRQPNAVATITNWPATAGVTAAIQRSRPSAGPAMPKNACSAASSSARIRAKWPSSGSMSGSGRLGARRCRRMPAHRALAVARFSDFATRAACISRRAWRAPRRRRRCRRHACGRAPPRPCPRETGRAAHLS